MNKEINNTETFKSEINPSDIRYNYIYGSIIRIEISHKLVIRYLLKPKYKSLENKKELFLNSIQLNNKTLNLNFNDIFSLLRRITIEYPSISVGKDLSVRMVENIEIHNVYPRTTQLYCLAILSLADKHFYPVKDHAESGPAEYHFHIEYKKNHRYKMRMSFDPSETTDVTFNSDRHPLYWDKHNHGMKTYLNNENNNQKRIIHSCCLKMKGKMSVSAFAILSQEKKLYWKD